jgi:hypothetical protein
MIAVIFEVFPADGRKGDYLEQAARLKVELERMDGSRQTVVSVLLARRGSGRLLALSY